ncbi:MAG TPA: hypothetical protein VG053_04065 [Solirubrobacteraceae bacterium]|nr:hypothetical protein [Solirubrobacteraceae bacterium]
MRGHVAGAGAVSPKWARRAVAGCVTLLVGVLLGGASAGPALAGLPEVRVYEQVSPEFKAGYPVFEVGLYKALALDGESVEYVSVGAFSGSGEDFALNRYVARRTSQGWVSSGLFPSPTGGECYTGLELMSPDLSRFEFLGSPSPTARGCQFSPTLTAWVREPDGSLAKASPAMTTASGQENSGAIEGGSSDLSREVFEHQDTPPEHLFEEDETRVGNELFELEVGSPSIRLIGVDNGGAQLTRYCDVNLGGGDEAFDAISQPDAAQVLFSVAIGTRSSADGACEAGPEHPTELFARLGGTHTIEISRPLSEGACLEVPCTRAKKPASALFQGASEDGSKVFFTSEQPLVAGDEDHSDNLYMATIGCPGGSGTCAAAQREVTSLALLSRDPHPGQGAEVEPHVAVISPDGSHAYFVARGVLSEGANAEGEAPERGAENLYVYDGASGKVAFVAGLCSGPERSGAVSDGRCPASLDGNDQTLWSKANFHEVQTTPDGAFLVFSTYAQLISAGPEADTDAAKDVYRYDAATGRLQRVSIGEAGADGNGNDSAFNASIGETHFSGVLQQQYELESRAISADGSRVVFLTSAPLSTRAVNGQPDVYVWSEGRVGLISSGTSIEPDTGQTIDQSGRDILFMTSAGLVPGDTDGLRDLYDARIGGGFPLAPASREPCAGDACQGPLSTPAPTLVPGSASQPAGGNLPAPPPPAVATTKAKAAKPRKVPKKHGGKAHSKSRQGKRARKSAHGAAGGRGGR